MKKKLILILAPLLLSTSFSSYAADKAGQAQQKMNRFQSAIKQFQKKMKFHQRCMQGKCSPEEKAQAKAELKKAAKIAIPTAIGVIVIVIGGTVAYTRIRKGRLPKKAPAPIIDNLKLKPAPIIDNLKLKIDVENAISNRKLADFKNAIQDISDDQKPLLAQKLVNDPRNIEMFKVFIEKYPEAVNVQVKSWSGNIPLLSEVIGGDLSEKEEDFVNTLLEHEKIIVYWKDFEDSPLFEALYRPGQPWAEKILAKLTEKEIQSYRDSKTNNEFALEQLEKLKKLLKK